MIFIRFFDEPLAQASYLIGCAQSGAAIVIDPNRHTRQYLDAAEHESLRLVAVTETHIHADFVSGSRALARETGATLYLSGCGPPEWQYRFGREPGIVLLADGDRIEVGTVRLVARHTPGHTPEHLSFLVTDTAATPDPIGILTGDFVFVNDVGRPDLLEKTARVSGAAQAGAAALWKSLAWFRTLPAHLQVWPGHGAGSACGKSLSPMPQSTVGYEQRANWALRVNDESRFVAEVLAGQPEPPRYFREMKRINREGPPLLDQTPAPSPFPGPIAPLLATGAVLVDTRSAAEYAKAHIPGTLNIPFNQSFTTWAGSLIPYSRELYLLIAPDSPDRLRQIVETLRLIGLDAVAGYLGPDALSRWTREGQALERIDHLSIAQIASAQPAVRILDVRGRSEWEEGHIPGATHIPLAELPERLAELDDRPIAVHCQGGGRSAIAASLLVSRGHDAKNVTGGFGAWLGAGLPVEHSEPPA